MRSLHPSSLIISRACRWTLQYVHVFLTEERRTRCSIPGVASPMLSRGLHHLPCLAASTPPNAAQDTMCLLCCRGTFLPHGRCDVHQCAVPFLPGCFPAVQPAVCTGACSSSSPRAGLGASLFWTAWGSCQPVQVSPNGCTAPSAYQLLLPVWRHLHLCWGCTVHPIIQMQLQICPRRKQQ